MDTNNNIDQTEPATNCHPELRALGNMLTATCQWDAGRLRAIAKRVSHFADRALDHVLNDTAKRLITIQETNPEIEVGSEIDRLLHAIPAETPPQPLEAETGES